MKTKKEYCDERLELFQKSRDDVEFEASRLSLIENTLLELLQD